MEPGTNSLVFSDGIIFDVFLAYNPPNWNEYVSAERTNKYIANKIKQHEKALVAQAFRGCEYTGGYPAQLEIRPHFANKRKDLDNTRYKGILDGLVAANVIKNDNLNCIQRIIIEPVFDDMEGMDITVRGIHEGL
jgi:Holliday junction resolvase RusA-like endonuclease